MKLLINKMISFIKKENFELDAHMSVRSIIFILIRRAISVAKGLKYNLISKDVKFPFFLGKNAEIRHQHLVEIGSGVTLGDYAVIDALSKNKVIIGNNVNIGAYTRIFSTGTIKKIGSGVYIGDNSGVGEFSYIGAAGGVYIGKNVIMGQNVRFHSENHIYTDTNLPIRLQGVTNKGIKVNDDCWIGSGVVILDGVEIGEGCVIGANTLVNKSISAYSVAVGNPVRIINNRKERLK